MFKKSKPKQLIDADHLPTEYREVLREQRDPKIEAVDQIELLSSHLRLKVDNFEYHSQMNIDGKVIEINVSVTSP